MLLILNYSHIVLVILKLTIKTNQDVRFFFPGDGELGAHSFWLANCSDTFKVSSSLV